MTFSPEQLMMFYIANQVLSALVQALPPPNGNKFYNFFYKFVSLITADFKSFAAATPAPRAGSTASLPVASTVSTVSAAGSANSGVL